MDPPLDELLQEQLAYYRARAGEYDEWFLRRGRYDRGPELNQLWFAEVAEVADALARFRPAGRVLELACGTGWWTQQLLRFADSLTALDASPEVLALNQARIGPGKVRYVLADLFTWEPDGRYDAVFFSFWLSHVPPDRFDPFWSRVRSCLAPSGRVFFVDSRDEPTSTALDQPLQHPLLPPTPAASTTAGSSASSSSSTTPKSSLPAWKPSAGASPSSPRPTISSTASAQSPEPRRRL